MMTSFPRSQWYVFLLWPGEGTNVWAHDRKNVGGSKKEGLGFTLGGPHNRDYYISGRRLDQEAGAPGCAWLHGDSMHQCKTKKLW